MKNSHGEMEQMCESCALVEKQIDKFKNHTEDKTEHYTRIELRSGEELKS